MYLVTYILPIMQDGLRRDVFDCSTLFPRQIYILSPNYVAPVPSFFPTHFVRNRIDKDLGDSI